MPQHGANLPAAALASWWTVMTSCSGCNTFPGLFLMHWPGLRCLRTWAPTTRRKNHLHAPLVSASSTARVVNWALWARFGLRKRIFMPQLLGWPSSRNPDSQACVEPIETPANLTKGSGVPSCLWTWRSAGTEQRTSWGSWKSGCQGSAVHQHPVQQCLAPKQPLATSVPLKCCSCRCHKPLVGGCQQGLLVHPPHATALNRSTNNARMSTSKKPKALTSSPESCVSCTICNRRHSRI